MKRFRYIVMMIALVAIGVTSCKKDTPPQTDINPKVDIALKSVDATTAVFTITATDAEEVYVYCVEGTESATPETIKASGTKVEGAEATISDLKPDTDYTAYALATANGGEKHAVDTIEFTTSSSAPFEGYELDKFVSAVYRTDNEAFAGNYEVIFGNTTEMEWVGDIQVFIDLYNVADEDPLNPVLPNGIYEPNSDYSAFSYNPSNSYVEIIVEGGEKISSPIIGTVTVERTGPTYTITVKGTLMLLDNMWFSARYTGSLQFVQGGTSAYERFDENVNISVKDAQMRYWGGWFYPFCDDVGIEMFDGEFDENGTIARGYYLHISRVFMPKYEDYNAEYVPLANGVYDIYPQALPSSQYCLPYAIEYGRTENLFGDDYFLGTYITYTDGSTKKVAFITGGTMTVESSGNTYNITIDFVADNGINVTASYSGELVVGNLNDNDTTKPETPMTTLTGDYTYNIPSGATYSGWCFGEYMKKGYDSWFMTIMAFNSTYPDGYGDMFTAEFLVETGGARDKLPTGTYNVAMSVEDHTMFPGIVDYGGAINFTWYGDLTPDAEGYSSQVAPIVSGTVTIEDAGNDELRFVFDLTDDGGNKITGEWTGPGEAYDSSSDIEPAPLTLRR